MGSVDGHLPSETRDAGGESRHSVDRAPPHGPFPNKCRPRRVGGWVAGCGLALVVVYLLFLRAGALVVEVTGWPPCSYGVGYRTPFVVQLHRLDGRLVAQADQAGITLDPGSTDVWLYGREPSPPFVGRLRVGRCPDLLDGGFEEALRCEEPVWVSERLVYVMPASFDRPHRLRVRSVTAACLEPS